ncbi:hypothetical protein [Cytobacillus massiliigabonensis]|uniref:hypothetical protein n=1 Tax=Cytobacillus massiliigabonensis TaxID=1871011 RepID=UPI000C85D0BA|nr:hypothetical protein [Cytobacillus massiliigabonensis]
MAQNKVIAGDYEGSIVMGFVTPGIYPTPKTPIELTKENVNSYEVITEEHRKSAASGITRGLVGGALLGPVGLLVGLTAKTKGTHVIAIEFKDGKKSLIEIDEKLYKALIKRLF